MQTTKAIEQLLVEWISQEVLLGIGHQPVNLTLHHEQEKNQLWKSGIQRLVRLPGIHP